MQMRAPQAERGLDLYETSPVAIRAVLRTERPPQNMFELAAGPDAIARTARDAGHHVLATGTINYKSPDQGDPRAANCREVRSSPYDLVLDLGDHKRGVGYDLNSVAGGRIVGFVPTRAAGPTEMATLGKIVLMLSSDQPGEVVAARDALKRGLALEGHDLYWLAEQVDRCIASLHGGHEGSVHNAEADEIDHQAAAKWLLDNFASLLSAKEWDFVERMTRWVGEPSIRKRIG